jgi:chorismate mutase
VAVRAVRGATRLAADQPAEMLAATGELLTEILRRNRWGVDQLISILFTATADLCSEFPAHAVRRLGITDVPLLCAREIEVPGAMPRVVRLLAHVETELSRAAVQHVYLRGAEALRDDLPQ